MYNYYTYLKQLNDDDQHDVGVKKEAKIKKAHKSIYNVSNSLIDLTNQLIKKYNDRINQFAFEMIKNPLVIRDYGKPIETTRKQFMDETSSQGEGGGKRKGFIFSKYLTEKERIVSIDLLNSVN